jgi:hypothetical protein
MSRTTDAVPMCRRSSTSMFCAHARACVASSARKRRCYATSSGKLAGSDAFATLGTSYVFANIVFAYYAAGCRRARGRCRGRLSWLRICPADARALVRASASRLASAGGAPLTVRFLLYARVEVCILPDSERGALARKRRELRAARVADKMQGSGRRAESALGAQPAPAALAGDSTGGAVRQRCMRRRRGEGGTLP